MIGETTTVSCTAKDGNSEADKVRSSTNTLTITWVTYAPYFKTDLATEMTFHAGVNSEQTLPVISCCDDAADTSYTVELSETQGLNDFFSYDKNANKLKFTDNDKKAKSYIAQQGLKLSIVLER